LFKSISLLCFYGLALPPAGHSEIIALRRLPLRDSAGRFAPCPSTRYELICIADTGAAYEVESAP
jgi:hypothetical protein